MKENVYRGTDVEDRRKRIQLEWWHQTLLRRQKGVAQEGRELEHREGLRRNVNVGKKTGEPGGYLRGGQRKGRPKRERNESKGSREKESQWLEVTE